MKIETKVKLDKDLLEALEILAESDRLSVSKLIEKILYKEVHIPNKETEQALEDAYHNKNLTTIEDYEKWRASVLKGIFDN